MVEEVTPQEQSQRLISQQNQQLEVLKNVGTALCDLDNVEELMQRTAEQLFGTLGLEVVGLAIRRDRSGQRSQQLIHRGTMPYLLEPHRRLVDAIERELMPEVLQGGDVAFWPDLQGSGDWAGQALNAGLTSLAAAPMRGSADSQGIVWIARRGGERLERHHIYMLETLAPLIAARLQIAQLGERMNQLMQQLRSGVQAGTDQDIDLAQAVQEAVASRQGQDPMPQYSLCDDSLQVRTDRARLVAVLGNVIQNAQDATPDDGRVEVSLRAEGDAALIEISDNGSGMTAEFVRERLFRPFDTSKGTTGMGIGAFEAREFARQLGGDAEVESAPGEGTRFRLRLPVSLGQRDAPTLVAGGES